VGELLYYNTWNVIIIMDLYMNFVLCGYCCEIFDRDSLSFVENHEESKNEILLNNIS
jgi:hypothetical protein